MEDEKKEFDENHSTLMRKEDYQSELAAIIDSDLDDDAIREQLEDYHENDIAAVLENLPRAERRKLYKILGVDRVSEVFTYLEDVGSYVDELDAPTAARIIESMDADDAVDVLDELEETKKQELITLLDEDAREDIDLIHSYSDDQIGSKLTTNYIVIPYDITVKAAMRALVEQAAENDNISTIYVVNDDDMFYGAIPLDALIIAREYTELESLITTSYPYVYATETIDDCIEELKDYSEDSIPVLDAEMHILGIITATDIVEVVDEEMGEDYAMFAGLTAEEDLQEPLLKSMQKRIPWLITLLFLGLLVSSVVGLFENVVAQLTLVVCFQSLILDMAGNVGTQSLAVTIRVLMDENLTFGQKSGLVFKEMRVGFANGLILGILSFVFIGFYIWLFRAKTVLFAFAVSGCIGIALLIAMVISSFMGTIIPIFFNKIKVDPAVASGPLITTVNDLVAVITYYGLTWILLINVLHLVE